MERRKLVLPQSGRLDVSLAEELPDQSRSALQKLIRKGEVRVNGNVILRPAYPVEAGDEIDLILPSRSGQALVPQAIPLDILFENEDVIVINKPAGMVVHPAPGHEEGTLANAVLAHAPAVAAMAAEGRPGIVHRLDMDTSGVIVVAKNQQAMAELQGQFEARQVRKIYLGLVDGRPPTPSGMVEAAIARDPRHRKRFAISRMPEAREAITLYRTRETYARHSLLELEPQTGRTHQIRLHMKSLKCPIVGDTVYGRRRPTIPVERQMLHALKLELQLPGFEGRRGFEAPAPDDFREAIELVRAGGD